MPHLNSKGPTGEGPCTGRKLGKCTKVNEDVKLEKLGNGMGKRRKSGGGEGMGRRSNYYK